MSETVATNTETTTTTTPATTTVADGLPSLGEKWYEKLSDDLKEEPSLRTIHDLPSLAKSYVHAQKSIGADKLVIPSKHATPEDWTKVFQKLGLPEKLDDYKIDVPKDVQINEAFVNSAKEQLFKLGVMPKAATELVNWFIGEDKKMLTERENMMKTNQDKWTGDLKKEWGTAFDQYSADSKRAIDHINDPELTKVLKETGLGNHPAIVKAFNKFSKFLVESRVLSPSGTQKSPVDAEKAANSILGNFDHPYHKGEHPGHKAAVKEMEDLFAQMHPEPELA